MKKEIKALDEDVSLFLVDALKYQDVIVNILKKLKQKKGVYVALNKPSKKLKKLFSSKNLFFLDAVGKEKEKDVDLLTPQNLSEISIKIKKKSKDYDFVLFDTIDSFLTYNKKQYVERFLTDIVGYIRDNNKKAVLIGIKQELIKHDLLNSVERISDEVVDLGASASKAFEETFAKL